MARNLLEKAGRIQLPATRSREEDAEDPPTPSGPVLTPRLKPKTAPGTLMGFMATQSVAVQENEKLRSQLERFDGSHPVRLLNPKFVQRSQWANRHEASFETKEFEELKEEIKAAGGNIQPIKVRPIPSQSLQEKGVGPSNPPEADHSGQFEIVYGHRRHRACLELELPVLALVEETSEQKLFVQMERENRQRADLSAWEQGMMYARALDNGLYPSNRQLASAIGRDVGDVGRALSLARLPSAVIAAFRSPLDLQFRWAKPLNDAQQSDPDGLLSRAKALAGKSSTLPAKAVFEALLGTSEPILAQRRRPAQTVMKFKGKAFGVITADPQGRTLIQLEQTLDDSGLKSVTAAIIEALFKKQ